MFAKVLLVLLEIGFGLKFNIVGSISLTEIFLLITFPFYFNKTIFQNTPILKRITWLYIAIFFFQILSETILGTPIQSAVRGYATTVFSYLHMYVLVLFFIKQRRLVVYALIGMVLNRLIFGSEIDGEVSEVLAGEGAAFLKFYVAPIVINLLILMSIFFTKSRMSIICIAAGVIFIFLGARSAGLLVLLTGLITYAFSVFKADLIRKRILVFSVVFLLIGYVGFAFYIERVLSGEITAGNSQQMKEATNPYNPINLLMLGRTETFVGWNAFMDQFWFGNGGNAVDNSGKYRELLYNYRDEDYRETDKDIIPSHSVLIGTGMQYGVFAFAAMFCLLYSFLQIGFLSIHGRDKYVIVVVFFLLSVFWNTLFSPFAHFRITLPLYFAFIISTHVIHLRAKTVMQL